MPSSCSCCGDLLPNGLGRRDFLRLFAGVSVGAAMTVAGAGRLFAASGASYRAMLLSCIDPRMVEPVHRYMVDRGLKGEYSQFTIAGAAIGVVAPAFADWRPAFWENLAASMELHKIPKIIAIDHRDCGAAKIAYGADAVKDRATETATHQKALAEFRREVHRRHPGLEIETGLMSLDGTLEMFS
jgi:carbonic anhydrase